MTGSGTGRFLETTLFVADAPPEPGAPLQLRGSHCVACQRWEFPARSYCPTCDAAVTHAGLSASGRVAGLTAVLHAPPDVQIDVPYTVALVDFPEGISVLGVVPGLRFDEIEIGDPVSTVAMTVGTDIGYGFRPLQADHV